MATAKKPELDHEFAPYPERLEHLDGVCCECGDYHDERRSLTPRDPFEARLANLAIADTLMPDSYFVPMPEPEPHPACSEHARCDLNGCRECCGCGQNMTEWRMACRMARSHERLYVPEPPITDESLIARNHALREALRNVLRLIDRKAFMAHDDLEVVWRAEAALVEDER